MLVFSQAEEEFWQCADKNSVPHPVRPSQIPMRKLNSMGLAVTARRHAFRKFQDPMAKAKSRVPFGRSVAPPDVNAIDGTNPKIARRASRLQ